MGSKTVKTIEDIARLANVSKSTVSRALSDSYKIRFKSHSNSGANRTVIPG